MCKSNLETQWKSNNDFACDKNSELAAYELAKVLLQTRILRGVNKNSELAVYEIAVVLLKSKESQNCLGLTPAKCVLVLS